VSYVGFALLCDLRESFAYFAVKGSCSTFPL
jgi:hypothetical protein